MKPRTLAVIPKTAWPRIRRRLLIPIGTLAVIVALYLGVSYVILAKSLEPIRTVSDRTPVGEEISFESDVDRLPLTGWLLASSGDRAIVLVHGLSSHSWCGGQPDIAWAFVKAGFHVLVFDLRGHGRSGGDLLGLGWHERRDVRGAVNLLLARGFRPGRIGIQGGSYGAAVALLATAAIPEVGAVVAYSAFADMRDLMDAEIERKTGVPSRVTKLFLRPGIALVARLLYSLDFDAITPERAVPEIAPRPILFIHGSEDERIPVEHAYRLMAASNNADAELWRLEGFGHGGAVRLPEEGCKWTEVSPMREAFLRRVTAFFDHSLR
jgi:pimeloyl-ACP methyl ester carboxylesterase